MRLSALQITTAMVAFCCMVATGCKRFNGIDNDHILQVPYTLYYSDADGTLFNTNNGEQTRIVFPPDGFVVRSMVVTGTNIIFVKSNVHLSEDNGLNFNPVNLNASPLAQWQQMMVDVKDHNRVYLAAMAGNGIMYSENKGQTWLVDNNWHDDAVLPSAGIQSFAQLADKRLFAYAILDGILYVRNDQGSGWINVEPNLPLPAGAFYLASMNNTLIAVDYTGVEGAWYTNDGGVNWYKYDGLPNTPLLAATSPYGYDFLIGTEGAGLYRLQGSGFVPATNGLEHATSVYGIAGKKNIYKGNEVRREIFVTTSDGLFKSEDGGLNWILVKPGDLRSAY